MIAALLCACARPAAVEGTDAPHAAPPRPAACTSVPLSLGLQDAVDRAQPGDALCLEPGRHRGPVRFGKPLTLWGARDAVIETTGNGTTVEVDAEGVQLLGFTVDGSGHRVDTLDAALKLEASHTTVDGVRIEHATFGILVDKAKNVRIANCEIQGDPAQAVGMRGDAIRLWETQDSIVEDNRVMDSRDVVVWYSSGNTLRGNQVVRGRYGTHLMFSHRNSITRSRYVGDVVGLFLMYSRDVRVEDDLFADAAGSAGMGIGMKESGNVTVRRNAFVHDTIGLYLDSSPLQVDDHNLFERNQFRLGQAGVVFHGSETRNTFRANAFRDNAQQVQVEGDGDALGMQFEGNDFDDYAGFDLDRDGVGDLPYELKSLTGELAQKHPELAFFQGTPALSLLEAVGRAVPLFAPRTLVRDRTPHVGALSPEVIDAR